MAKPAGLGTARQMVGDGTHEPGTGQNGLGTKRAGPGHGVGVDMRPVGDHIDAVGSERADETIRFGMLQIDERNHRSHSVVA